MQKIRLFVSSPSDVAAERRRVDNVIKRIQLDYEGIEFEIIRWEESFYTAQSTFQNQISSSADADIVLCILWKRLGSPLPDEYQRKDGSSRTGTEYEFETAMEAALTANVPDILVYRGTSEITFSADHVEQEQAELQMLESFWRRWIQNEKGHFTAGFKPFENTDEFESLLEKDLRAWLKRRFHQVNWPETKGSPYRGLDVFEEEHAPIYFGRRRAINEVRARLIANEQRDGIGFLLIIGASGAGKSSLVRAGLIPALKETHQIDGVAGWRTLVIRPTKLGADPINGLCNQLCDVDVLPELLEGDYEQPGELATLFKNSADSAVKPIEAALKRWAKVLTKQEQMSEEADTRLFIAIDQFEELFQFDIDQQILFLNIIDNLVHSGKVWIVATMRSDFYPQLFSLPELIRLKDASRQYDLNIPRQHELQDIITGPATAAGLIFEQNEHGEGLDQRLLEDAEGNPAALPLLEFTLERLYQEHDRDNKQLTFKAYKKLGGLQGALTQTAEDAFAKIKNQFKDNIDLVFARVMRELIAIDEQGKATRRVATLKRFETKSDDKLLVNTLLEYRLLTGYTSDINTTDTPEPVVNITHEALIHYWERMQRWLEQDQELLQVRERITQDYQRWKNENHRKDLLATSGKRLEDIRYLKNSELQLDNTTLDYIDASLLRAKQLHKRKRRLQVSFSVVSIMAAIFGAITLSSIDELQAQKIEIDTKEQQLISSSIKSTGLIAEAEYVKATILKNQDNNIEAFNSYFKAINRAHEVENLRQGKQASKNKKHDPDWLINTTRESVWHIDNLVEKNKLTKGYSAYPLISNNEKLVLISSKDDNEKKSSTLFNISSKKIIAGPFPTEEVFSYLKVNFAAFSPNDKIIALVVNETNKRIQPNKKRRSHIRTNSIKIINTQSGSPENNELLDIHDIDEMHFLDNNRLAILHGNKIRIWDTRNTQIFSELKSDIPAYDRYTSQFHVISNNTLLLDDQYIWQEEENGDWKEIGSIKTIQPLGINFNNNNPIITKDGFITITSEYVSWLPNFVMDILAGTFELYSLTETFASYIKIKPGLAVTKVNGDNISTEYIAIPLVNNLIDSNSGYFSNTLLLRKSNNEKKLSFISVTTDLNDKTSYTYRYEFPLASNTKVSPPTLINTTSMSEAKYLTGYAQLNKNTIVYSTIDGGIIHLDIKRNHKIQTSRATTVITGILDLKDNILLATKSGTYLVLKPTIPVKQTSNNKKRLKIAKDIFTKYASSYPAGKIWPNVFVNKESGKLALSHKNDNRKINTLVELRHQENLTKRLNVLGLTFVNILHGDSGRETTIMAASQLHPASSTKRESQRVAHNGTWNKIPISQVNIAPDAEHYTLLTNDNKLHLMQSHPSMYAEKYSHIKSKIQKVATGTENISAATEDGFIHILNIKNDKKTRFNPNNKISSKQVAFDSIDQPKPNNKSLQGITSSLAWHPSKNILATGNWNGALHLFSNIKNTVTHDSTAKHTNNSPIRTIKWNSSGSQIASADRIGTVNLWTVKTNNNSSQLIHKAKLIHDSSVTAINYSVDNQWIVTATDTDKLYFWNAEGLSLGNPMELKDIDVRDVLINEDNWWITIFAKDGSAHTVEAGDKFIPNKVIKYFDLMTRNELFKQKILTPEVKDTDNILKYYRNPPQSDRTYWTTLMNSLFLCYASKDCQDKSSLAENIISNLKNN